MADNHGFAETGQGALPIVSDSLHLSDMAVTRVLGASSAMSLTAEWPGRKADATAYAFAVREAVLLVTRAGARTTREIADGLNAAGLRSRQGGRWHPASVARIVRRLGVSLR